MDHRGEVAIAIFTPASLVAERLAELRALARRADAVPTLAAALSVFAANAARALGGPVMIFSRTVDTWTLSVHAEVADSMVRLPAKADLEALRKRVERHVHLAADGQPWTALVLGTTSPRWLLVLPGDWLAWPAAGWLELFTEDLSRGLEAAALADSVRVAQEAMVAVYRLLRRLSAVRGEAVHQAIVDATAGALHAQRVSLAVFDTREDALVITAARGYLKAIVQDIRIRAGDGIIGRVFETGRLTLASSGPEWSPRRIGFRSSSFLAVPVYARATPIGVVSITDLADGRPWTDADLTLARVLAAAAAPALLAEDLRGECRTLRRAAAVDPLTGLSNRRHFEARLGQEIERAERHGRSLSVLVVDVDHFKEMNDRFGHAVGDLVLQNVATLMRTSVRAFDVCARLGGDEFAMVLTDTTAREATLSADRLRRRVETVEEPAVRAAAEHLTLSVGVTELKPGESPSDLLSRADCALYAAKLQGRNRVAIIPANAPPPGSRVEFS